jgi:hypothetical protein
MERIFEDMTFDQLVCDRDIIEGMYGSVDEGNALVTIARPSFVPLADRNDSHPDKDNHHKDEIPPFVADPYNIYQPGSSFLVSSLLSLPFHLFLLSSILTTRFPRPLQYQY